MASFQAKIGGERPRKRKIKIFFPFPSDRTGNRKFQKMRRKFKKIKKYHCGFISSKNRLEKVEKIKNFVPFRSHPTRNKKFQKNSKNFQKIKKPCYGFFSSQNSLEKAEKERK